MLFARSGLVLLLAAHTVFPGGCALNENLVFTTILASATESTEAMKDSAQCDHAWQPIAALLAEVNELKRLSNPLAGVVRDLSSQARLLRELVTASVERGELQQARRLVSLIPTKEEQIQAIWMLAPAYAKVGQATEARELASRITDQRRRDFVLRDVARVQAESRDATGALHTVELIRTRATQETAIESIAIAQAQAGDGRGGLQTAERVHGVLNRLSVVYWMAKTQAEAGDVQGATAWARDLKIPQERSSALLGVADGSPTGRAPS